MFANPFTVLHQMWPEILIYGLNSFSFALYEKYETLPIVRNNVPLQILQMKINANGTYRALERLIIFFGRAVTPIFASKVQHK